MFKLLLGVSISSLLIWLFIVLNLLIAFQNVANLSKYSSESCQPQLELCPLKPPHFVGEFSPDFSQEVLEAVEWRFGNHLQDGGFYTPERCMARERVAIIVPVRDRDWQIPIFLKNIHPFMMRQQMEYQIFIIFQEHGYWFNKASLFNVGFLEALKVRKWDCFIFHDVDMVPINDRNLYNCPKTNPRHMGVAVDKFGYKLQAEAMVGGAFGATLEQYIAVNGHSNSFWGWGGEDNDMYNRVIGAGYYVERYPLNITRYRSIPHKPSFQNDEWQKEIKRGHFRHAIDGLNTLKYHVLEIELKRTFTRILVKFIPEEMGRNSSEILEGKKKKPKQ